MLISALKLWEFTLEFLNLPAACKPVRCNIKSILNYQLIVYVYFVGTELSCDKVSSYPDFPRNLFNSTLIENDFEDFESNSDVLYLFDIPKNYSTSGCSSMEITVETCYTSSMDTNKHSNIYIKTVQYDEQSNSYDIILVETYKTVGPNLNQSCTEVPDENSTYACCQTFELDMRFWELDNFSKIGVAYGGTVVKPLFLADESRFLETYTFIYSGNVHEPIYRVNNSSQSPLLQFIITPSKPTRYSVLYLLYYNTNESN